MTEDKISMDFLYSFEITAERFSHQSVESKSADLSDIILWFSRPRNVFWTKRTLLFFSNVSSPHCSFFLAPNCCIRPAPSCQCNSFDGVVAAFFGFSSVALFYDISKSSMWSRRSLFLFSLVRARLWISQPICLCVCMADGVCKCVKKFFFATYYYYYYFRWKHR